MYPQTDLERIKTMPYLDELLSDKDFYEFLDALYYYAEGLYGTQNMTDEMKEHFRGLDIEKLFHMATSNVYAGIYTERDCKTLT